jgi:hypothetical protein
MVFKDFCPGLVIQGILQVESTIDVKFSPIRGRAVVGLQRLAHAFRQ